MAPRKPTRGYGKGRSPTKFSYTYEDVASLIGCSIQAARKHAQRGNFDPTDLLSVLEFVRDQLQGQQPLQESESLALLKKIGESGNNS